MKVVPDIVFDFKSVPLNGFAGGVFSATGTVPPIAPTAGFRLLTASKKVSSLLDEAFYPGVLLSFVLARSLFLLVIGLVAANLSFTAGDRV